MENPHKPLRVMCWNILEGWHKAGRKADLPQLQPHRLEAAQALIAQVAPDILVLNEALWCRPHNGHFVDYAKLLGFAHTFCDTYDNEWGNAIVSNLPLDDNFRFRIHNRGGLRVKVEFNGWHASVATYHPHPSRYPANKASDYAALVASGLDHPLVVCGDFNAISPEDSVDEVQMVQAFSRFSENPASDLARFTDGGRRVFDALSSMGMRDAIALDDRTYTMPTDLQSRDKSSGMRIDHAWVNAKTQVVAGKILHDPLADIASDHYPLVIDILPSTE